MAYPSIFATPDPAHQGGTISVAYMTTGGETTVNLTVTFDRDGEPVVEHLVWHPGDVLVVGVPQDAEGCLIIDESGGAQDVAVTIVP